MGDVKSISGTPPPSATTLETATGLGDLALAASCLISAGLGYFVLVPRWVYVPAKVAGTLDSPAFFPQALFILLALLAGLLLVQTLLAVSRIAAESRAPRADWRRAGTMLAICLFYLCAVFLIGLPVASAVSMALTLLYFGERRLFVVGLASVLLPMLLWLFFVEIALVPMPKPLIELPGLAFFDGVFAQSD